MVLLEVDGKEMYVKELNFDFVSIEIFRLRLMKYF